MVAMGPSRQQYIPKKMGNKKRRQSRRRRPRSLYPTSFWKSIIEFFVELGAGDYFNLRGLCRHSLVSIFINIKYITKNVCLQRTGAHSLRLV